MKRNKRESARERERVENETLKNMLLINMQHANVFHY